MEDIAATLRDDYEAFVNQPEPFGFFSGLSDYMGYALENPTLKAIVDEAMKPKQALFDEYDRLEQQTMREMKVAEKKIRKIIADNKIDPASITMVFSTGPNMRQEQNLLERLEVFDKSQPGHGNSKWHTFGQYLFDIAVNLARQGYGEQLKEFTVPASEWGHHHEDPYPEDNTSGLVLAGNSLGNFVFSKTEPLVLKQDAHIAKEREYGAMWSVFDQLVKLRETVVARSGGISKYDFLNDYNRRHPARNKAEANDLWEVGLAFNDLSDMTMTGGIIECGSVPLPDDSYRYHRSYGSTTSRVVRHAHIGIFSKNSGSGRQKWPRLVVFQQPATSFVSTAKRSLYRGRKTQGLISCLKFC